MKFMAEISKPQYQAELPNTSPTVRPTGRRTNSALIDPARAKLLPSYPANAAKQLTLNVNWYMKFEAPATAAYQNMLTE